MRRLAQGEAGTLDNSDTNRRSARPLGDLAGALGCVLDLANSPPASEAWGGSAATTTGLNALLVELTNCFSSQMGYFLLYDEEGKLDYTTGVGASTAAHARAQTLARDQAEPLHSQTRPVTTGGAGRGADSTPFSSLLEDGSTQESVVALPLMAREEHLGFLVLHQQGTEAVRAEQIRDISLLAGLLAVILAAKRAEGNRAIRDRARDRFLSAMSHELRTPLTSILGFAQMLRKRVATSAQSDARMSEQIDVIWSQAHRLSRLIDTFVDMAHIDQGDFALTVAKVDLNEVLRSAAHQAAMQAGGETRLAIEMPERHVWVQGDRRRLEQVLTQVMANALRYSPNEKEVTVTLELDAAENGQVSIRVTDQGPGIPDVARSVIFDRFGRGDALKSGGLGVGLYLSKTIVEAHGGNLTIDSSPHKGTVVTIVLPT